MDDQQESSKALFREYLAELPRKCNFKLTPEVLKQIYSTIGTFMLLTEADLDPQDNNHYHVGRPCVRKFLKGETCYRCLTCGYDETCALCSYCFQPERHIGHQVHKSIIQRDNAGCCDCGDPEAYANPRCDYYNGIGLSKDNHKLQPPSPEYIENFSDMLSILLDYVIDVLSQSISCLVSPVTVEEVQKLSDASSLDQSTYGTSDPNSMQYALVVYNDLMHQYRDAVQRVRFATGKVPEFAKMIVERCQIHGRAIVMISDHISLLLKRQKILTTTGLTACIRSTRDIFRETMCDGIIRWLLKLSQSTIIKGSTELRNCFSRVFMRPHHDGCANQPLPVYKNGVLLSPAQLKYVPFQNEYMPPELVWSIPDDIKKECRYEDLAFVLPREGDGSYTFSASRFQFILFYDIRLCRLSRLRLHDMLVLMLVNNLRYKMLTTAQFLDIYDDLLTLFLSFDREPECSIMPTLTTQLFTCPSSCTAILRHGDVYKMIRSVDNYLRFGATSTSVRSPFALNKDGLLVSSLRNRKWGHMFMDLNYIITRNPDLLSIVYFLQCFPKIVHMFSLLQSRPMLKREAAKHVEYEFTDYGIFFNAASVVAHFGESIGKVFNRLDEAHLRLRNGGFISDMLYSPLIDKMVEISFLPHQNFFNSNSKTLGMVIEEREAPIKFINISCDDGTTRRYVDFDVLSGKVSFIHPLHSTLAWIMETDQSLNSPTMMGRVMQLINDITFKQVPSAHDGDGVKGLFDIPLRTLVWMSQIKVGLWVRNGLSVRTQMNIYKYSGIRECGFMKDLFLTQVLCSYLSPEEGMSTLLRRWGLLEWSEMRYELCKYGPQHTNEMVEEFLLFMINLLTEDFHLKKRFAVETLDMVIARELIHTLCFKPLNYSKMISLIPEHICAEKRFFIIFEKFTEEIPDKNHSSTQMQELKTYKLKDKYFSLVDPFYVYYSANRREDCVKVLKERIRKKIFKEKQKKVSISEIVLPPKHVDWSTSPYSALPKICCSRSFLQFIGACLQYCTHKSDNNDTSMSGKESIFSLLLHLLHIAVDQEQLTNFGSEYLYHTNIPRLLFSLLMNSRYCSFAPKIRAILHIFSHECGLNEEQVKHAIPEYVEDLVIPHSVNYTEEARKRKKLLAKKKRDRILAKIKHQQKMFEEKHSDEMAIDNGLETTKNNVDVNMNGDDESVEQEVDNSWNFPEERCILCQMLPESSDEPFGIFSHVSLGNEFRQVPYSDKDQYWFYKAFSDSPNLDEKSKYTDSELPNKSYLQAYLQDIESKSVIGPGFPNTDSCWNENYPIITSCCHGMHFSCYLNYIKSIKSKQISQITRTIPEDLQKHEFLCPLCKAVNNIFVPVIYGSSAESFTEQFGTPISISCLNSMENASLDTQMQIYTQHADDCVSVVKNELVNSVKQKVKLNHWFIEENNTTIDTESKAFIALEQAIGVMSTLSLPFDGISSAISSTIESAEISLRGIGYDEISNKNISRVVQTVQSQLSNQMITNLRVWCQFRDLVRSTETVTSTAPINSSSMNGKNEKQFLGYPYRLLGLISNICHDDDALYDGEDYFRLLVGAEPLRSLGLSFQRLAAICYKKHVKQCLLKIYTVLQHDGNSLNGDLLSCIGNVELTDHAKEVLRDALMAYLGTDGLTLSLDIGKVIYGMLVRLVTPFLRRVLIYSFIQFANISNDELSHRVQNCVSGLECDRICMTLGIPPLEEVVLSLQPVNFQNVSPENRVKLYDSRICYPGRIRLINLPIRLNDFFTKICGKLSSGNQPSEPAVCLFCGEVLDMQKTQYGDTYGSCHTHVIWDCIDSNGLGVFFVPRNNCVLLLSRKKGTFIEGPYVDIHGECDMDSKKGHDLHLCERKFDELSRIIWLEHNIQNHISRQMECQVDIGGWQTL